MCRHLAWPWLSWLGRQHAFRRHICDASRIAVVAASANAAVCFGYPRDKKQYFPKPRDHGNTGAGLAPARKHGDLPPHSAMAPCPQNQALEAIGESADHTRRDYEFEKHREAGPFTVAMIQSIFTGNVPSRTSLQSPLKRTRRMFRSSMVTHGHTSSPRIRIGSLGPP